MFDPLDNRPTNGNGFWTTDGTLGTVAEELRVGTDTVVVVRAGAVFGGGDGVAVAMTIGVPAAF